MRKRAPTQADVAKAAGVSQATVSIILNPGSKESRAISEATRQRVFQAIKDLGYVVNPAARSLAGGRNRLLGVFVNGSAFPLDKHSFYHPILMGIEEECIRQDYDMLLFTRSENGTGKRSIYRNGVNHLRIADGSILLGLENREELAKLCAEEYPFVFVGQREVPGRKISFVAADYAEGTTTMANRLMEQGHRQFAFVFRYRNDATQQRMQGLVHALHQQGLEPDSEKMYHWHPQLISPDFAKDLFRDGVTVVLTEDPPIAHEFAEAATAAGKTVCSDYSLSALSDSFLSEVTHEFAHSLHRLIIPRERMGREAVSLLHGLLEGSKLEPRQVYLPVTFHVGNSTGPMRNK